MLILYPSVHSWVVCWILSLLSLVFLFWLVKDCSRQANSALQCKNIFPSSLLMFWNSTHFTYSQCVYNVQSRWLWQFGDGSGLWVESLLPCAENWTLIVDLKMTCMSTCDYPTPSALLPRCYFTGRTICVLLYFLHQIISERNFYLTCIFTFDGTSHPSCYCNPPTLLDVVFYTELSTGGGCEPCWHTPPPRHIPHLSCIVGELMLQLHFALHISSSTQFSRYCVLSLCFYLVPCCLLCT